MLFDDEFKLVVGAFAFVCLIVMGGKRTPEMIIAILILVTPMLYSVVVPRSAFGVRGLSGANILWSLASLAVVIRVVGSGHLFSLIRMYLNVPLLLFISVFVMSAGLTFLTKDESTFYIAGGTTSELLLQEFLKPAQMAFIGWMAMVACFATGSKVFIQRVLLLAPILLLGIVIYFSYGTEMILDVGDLYQRRESLSWHLRLHANQVGALGVYLLILALLMNEHGWKNLRYVSIVCALICIVFAFSRIAFLSTAAILLLLVWRLEARERTFVFAAVGVVILAFSGDLIVRATNEIDLSGSAQDYNRISAGRIEGIWLPAFRMFVESPWIGNGLGTLVYAPYMSAYMPAHSAYLKLALDSGFLGLLALANFYFFALRESWHRRDELFFLLIAMAMLGLTGHQFYPYHSNYVLWVVYGMYVFELHANKIERGKRLSTMVQQAQ